MIEDVVVVEVLHGRIQDDVLLVHDRLVRPVHHVVHTVDRDPEVVIDDDPIIIIKHNRIIIMEKVVEEM